MSNNGARESFLSPVRRNIFNIFHHEFSIKTKLNLMAVAITLALAAALIITILGLNYSEKIHTAAIRSQNVVQNMMEIKASALSTIMLEPASPDTETVFADARQKIQENGGSAMENIDQPAMKQSLEKILSQWLEYERDSNELIRISRTDPKAAKAEVVTLYKQKFIPLRDNLESLIARSSSMADQIESDAAYGIWTVKWTVSLLILMIAGAIITMMLVITKSINANLRDREENLRLLLQEKEKVEEATKLKDKFVSLVAHDLKSPLTGMIGFLQLLRKEDVGPAGTNGSPDLLNRAINSGKQLGWLIDDLLNMNRLKTGQLKLDKSFFDAKELGARMCVDFSYSAEAKGIRLINLIPDKSIVFGDKTLLGEALQNLVSNAIKFCRRDDTVTISFSGLGRTAIEVKDNGPGMTPEKLEQLFDSGTKVSTVGTGGERGTGFGLALAKDIMLLHGGGLDAASTPGGGCVFTLNIPPSQEFHPSASN